MFKVIQANRLGGTSPKLETGKDCPPGGGACHGDYGDRVIATVVGRQDPSEASDSCSSP